MLINCVKEEEDDRVVEKEILHVDEVLEEYHTANELFELMAKNHPHNFDVLENNLTTRDLVILYENVDLGTKLMSNSNDCNKRASNQYVETIIYNDDIESEDSDAYEIYSHEDLQNVFSANSERLELYNNMPSFENTLCHKIGNIQMKTSNFLNGFENHIQFNDLYIKEQLQSFHAMTDAKQSDSAVLPTSLLDYICCKRLDDNYNFYMDNVINHVQNTIEQLKRISNGDYLTDRVKEKWREVKNIFDNKTKDNDNIIALSNTHNSIFPVVGKVSQKSTWDEIVHSEMDVRTLSKILEKKIIVQIPKLLRGSYGIFSESFKDDPTVKQSKKRVTVEIGEKSTMDVLLKLQRPDIGHHNVNSLIVLKTSAPSIIRKESCEVNCLTAAVHVKEVKCNQKEKLEIIELDDNENEITQENVTVTNSIKIDGEKKDEVSSCNDSMYETDTNSVSLLATDELGYAIHRLNIQSSVLEENEDCHVKKKKSATMVRIKSPYENKSCILDERKRKRLLEIRERREKKKLAMNENSRVNKNKYVKGTVMAQASNSVTKLSITNKSFYNSIYGQTHIANKNFRNVINKARKHDNIPGIDIQGYGEEFKKESSLTSLGKNGQKYINRSYYLDDADTEVMYLQMKPNNNEDDITEILTPSTSVLSNDVGKILINPSTTDLNSTDTSSLQQNISLEDSTENTNMQNICQNETKNAEIIVPSNTPKQEKSSRNEECKMITPVECRKSIDKIYDLMKKITVYPISHGNKPNELEEINNFPDKSTIESGNDNIIIHGSDSRTSVKLQLTSSDPSSFVVEKENPPVEEPRKYISKKTETSITVFPKVIISSKFETEKKDTSKTRKETIKADNPLKAISQLLHEIDNVQKIRHKNVKETKPPKKTDNTTVEDNNNSRQVLFKNAAREVKNTKHNEQGNSRFFKPVSPTKTLKFAQQIPRGDKTIHKKKLSDIIDEVKEMRGEAVRGPSKRISRIDNLAQPKKSYVQAHNENYQNRYSKNFIPRVQKLPVTPLSSQEKNTRTLNKNRQRGSAEISPGTVKQSNKIGSSLEKVVKSKRSASSSPVEKEKRLPAKRLPDNVNIDPDSLKKKMIAVETYLKNHFGRVSPTYKEQHKSLHKSRVPLIPTDIDIASIASSPLAEESTAIGNKLHNMINSKINTNTLAPSPEGKEETEREEIVDSIENLSKSDTARSTSDHPVDVFEDKNIITAVACISNEDNIYEEGRDHKIDTTRHELQEFKSHNELQKLENALYRQMSNGTFQKRLRIKNLTLTPKQSMQQIFVLQSGDANSVIVKSTLSQKLDLSKTDTVPKLNMLPIIPRNAIKCNLPTQIATVGYVFPTYQAFKNISNDKTNSLNIENFATNLEIITETKNNEWVDKTVQCYKGGKEWQSLKQNTDTKGYDMFNIKNVCSKDTFDVPKETVQHEPRIPIQEKIIPQNIGNSVYEHDNVKVENSDNISDSTSLDILVGLLNEIKKITTCQSNLVTSVNETHTSLESKEFKVILNNSVVRDNSDDQSVKNSVSITSFDYIPHRRPSNFFLYLQSNVDSVEKFKIDKDPPSFNKEKNVQIAPKEFVHRFTEVPSQFFPITVNRSTNVIKSLIALVNKASNESICSYSDCQILYSNTTFNDINIIQHVNNSNSNAKPDVKILQNNMTNNKTKNILNNFVKIKPQNNSTFAKNVVNRKKINTLQEFESIIKIKRDMLITVYSILVLTVFAALAIPEIVYDA